MSEEGFPKEKRLLTRRDFLRVQQKHTLITYQQILISLRPNRLKNSRLGVILTRKNGPSVERNLCRRRIRELFRRADLHSFQVDIVFRVRGKLATVSFEQIVQAFQLLLRTLNGYTQKSS